jgi:diguanylate cyclase (GGDEF)-like protein
MQGWWALLAWADNWSPEWMQLQTALLAAVVTAWALQYSRRNTALQLFESEQRFALQAQRDPLTSLPLRSSLVDRIGECFSRESRNAERKFGVCVLNLDGFQQVNEKHGHSIGDLLLQTVAERLQQGCRRTDVVARLGGDEFVILLEETPSPEHADSGADRLCGIACQPVELDDIHLEISASYGVAWSGAGFASEDAMLSSAHKAMQAAKARAGFIHQAIESHKGVRQTHALTSPA